MIASTYNSCSQREIYIRGRMIFAHQFFKSNSTVHLRRKQKYATVLCKTGSISRIATCVLEKCESKETRGKRRENEERRDGRRGGKRK